MPGEHGRYEILAVELLRSPPSCSTTTACVCVVCGVCGVCITVCVCCLCVCGRCVCLYLILHDTRRQSAAQHLLSISSRVHVLHIIARLTTNQDAGAFTSKVGPPNRQGDTAPVLRLGGTVHQADVRETASIRNRS